MPVLGIVRSEEKPLGAVEWGFPRLEITVAVARNLSKHLRRGETRLLRGENIF